MLDTLSLSEDLSGPTRALKIRETIKKSHGFEPQVLLLTPEEIESAIESNPFPEAESEPKTLHLHFLASMPKNPDLGALESIKGDHERFALKDGVVYLHAPDGIGRSKLAANAEKLLGVAVTSRNWRTVCKVIRLNPSPPAFSSLSSGEPSSNSKRPSASGLVRYPARATTSCTRRPARDSTPPRSPTVPWTGTSTSHGSPLQGGPNTYEARTAFYDPYRILGSDCWKWKKSSGSYLPLTRTKRSKLAL